MYLLDNCVFYMNDLAGNCVNPGGLVINKVIDGAWKRWWWVFQNQRRKRKAQRRLSTYIS